MIQKKNFSFILKNEQNPQNYTHARTQTREDIHTQLGINTLEMTTQEHKS